MTDISGKTRIYAIVADPIGHVKTPTAINRLAAERNIDAVMVPVWVGADDLAQFTIALKAMRNWGGAVVTVPHKSAAFSLCDEVTAEAAETGAVNVIRREPDGRLVGAMFDGIGFVEGLRQAGIDPHGHSVFLIGAGGAANAIALALTVAGISRLTIANRTRCKAEDLQARLLKSRPEAPVAIDDGQGPAGHTLIVNATSLGLGDSDPLPVDPAGFDSSMTVAEVIMQPEETALLAEARRRGCRIHAGWTMLACQLHLMADFLEIKNENC